MATIRKRGPYQWEVRIRKKGYPAQSKTLESKKDAEDWAHDIESEMRRGVFVCRKEAENTTLTEALDRYAKEITVNKKGAPQELLRIKAWKHLPLSQRFLATLRSVDFAQYRDNRQTQGKSPSTIRLELAIISHLFNIARKEWGMESLSNPVQAIRLSPTGRPRDRRLQGDEEERLLTACAASRSAALKEIVIIAIETGMRLGELLALRWPEIDTEKCVAQLPDTKNGERVFFEWKNSWSFESSWRRTLQRAYSGESGQSN
jgi:integrase